ncbi:MAG: hypothetical protein KDC44_07240 [Phaeodactylibacter sp.]|nr:hypothetical protein [Phaeodactylibacter sp.]
MMRLMKMLLPVLVLGLTLASCKKAEDDLMDNKPTDEWYFSCEINGDDYYVAGQYNAYVADFTDEFLIYGVDAAGNTLYISVAKGLAEGTYTMDDEQVFAYVIYADATTYATLVEGGSGTLTISKFDGTEAAGTFNFSAPNFDDPTDTAVITNGKFNAQFR